MLMRGLALADEAAQHAGERDDLIHCAAGGSRGKGLQMKGQMVLDGGIGGGNRLDLEGGANVGEI